MNENPNYHEIFSRWVSDGDTWIGVFECHDMSSSFLGHRIALSFPMEQFDKAVIGSTRAPDTRQIIGWRYLLACKTTDPPTAVAFMNHLEEEYFQQMEEIEYEERAS